MANSTEEIVWEGSESQVLNLGVFAMAFLIFAGIVVVSFLFFPLLLALLAVPVIYSFYHFLIIKSHKYKVTTERIFFTSGILSKKTDALELYRVKDMDVFEPFSMRMFKRGNIEIDSADESSPKFHLRAVPDPKNLMDKIRTNVEKRRDVKGVRGVDFQADHGVDGN
jgi:uncharacterized membrane protein YdbT with pleckstrin-like domain